MCINNNNNTITIAKSDLGKTLKTINDEVRSRLDRCGITEVIFQDAACNDTYRLRLQPQFGLAPGFSVGGFLNESAAYQLNGRVFSPDAGVGKVLLAVAGANENIDAVEFFG